MRTSPRPRTHRHRQARLRLPHAEEGRPRPLRGAVPVPHREDAIVRGLAPPRACTTVSAAARAATRSGSSVTSSTSSSPRRSSVSPRMRVSPCATRGTPPPNAASRPSARALVRANEAAFELYHRTLLEASRGGQESSSRAASTARWPPSSRSATRPPIRTSCSGDRRGRFAELLVEAGLAIKDQEGNSETDSAAGSCSRCTISPAKR